MLRSVKDLDNCALRATDGAIGRVSDVYFDDAAWAIRYFVVDTGTWLSGRKVLISPISIGHQDWATKQLPVSITREQVKNSPDIDTDKPVSRQHEIAYLGYYGYPYYWGGAGIWGVGAYPGMMLTGVSYGGSQADDQNARAERTRSTADAGPKDDSHLRSCQAVIGYHIHATDGDIGHVSDMLVDEETWAIRYLILDTSNWWLGHKVVIAPQWIRDVSWSDSSVSVSHTRQQIKDAPQFTSAADLNRQQEVGIYKHYGRAGYWANERQPTSTEPA